MSPALAANTAVSPGAPRPRSRRPPPRAHPACASSSITLAPDAANVGRDRLADAPRRSGDERGLAFQGDLHEARPYPSPRQRAGSSEAADLVLAHARPGRTVRPCQLPWRPCRTQSQRSQRRGRSSAPSGSSAATSTRADFDRLRDAGLLHLIAPVDQGGLWRIVRGVDAGAVRDATAPSPRATRPWRSCRRCTRRSSRSGCAAPTPTSPSGRSSARAVFASAVDGDQWGTITSEPGSGGDIAKTKSVATPVERRPGPCRARAYARHRRQALRQRVGCHRTG